MNSRILLFLRPAGAAALCLAFSSCSDDPAMVAKREQQRAEISKLESELAILQERMGQLPPDRSGDVEELKEKAEANQDEIVALESEIDELEREKTSIEREHESYRRKYAVR